MNSESAIDKRLANGSKVLILLLALLLLVAGLMAPLHERHHQLHASHEGGAETCLVCALAKGQCQSPTFSPTLAWFDAPFSFADAGQVEEPICGPTCALPGTRAPPLS